MAKAPYYIVVCKTDFPDGVYVLATHRQFRSRLDAEAYTQSVAVRREPIVVMVS